MSVAKIVVIYPRPTDVEAFEKLYLEEHMPIAQAKLKGVSKFAATKAVGTPDGSTPPFHRIAEIYFPSMQALLDCAGSPGAQEAIAHAFSISTGGPPIVLVTEDETLAF